MHVGIGQAEAEGAEVATGRALDQAAAGLNGVAPMAALVFACVDIDHDAMLGVIARRHPGLAVVGCSTAGEFSSALGFSEESVVVVLLASDRIRFTAGLGETVAASPEAAARQAVGSRGDAARMCLIFPDGRSRDTLAALRQLTALLPAECVVVGACSGRVGLSDRAPRQFFGTRVLADALPVLFMEGDVRHAFRVCNSWQTVGAPATITQADGERVQRIDDRGALDFYRHYLGPHRKPASEFPLAVFEDGGDEQYLRVPVGYDQDAGTVSFAAPMPVGARVQLTEASPDRILDDAGRTLTEVQGALDGPAGLALAFSCNARKGILGTRTDGELAILDRALGGAACAGFYGFGEISRAGGGVPARLHHATLVTVLIGDGDGGDGGDGPRPGPGPAGRDGADDIAVLRRKLARSEYYREDLEQIRDVNAALLRTVGAEIEQQKRELETLYAELAAEREKAEALLRNILPDVIADELKAKGHVEPVYYPSATILFTDFVDFTKRAAELAPSRLLATLDGFFTRFDAIISAHGLEKLKTIGDAYMCVGGVPAANDTHALDMVRAALDMQAHMAAEAEAARARGEEPWRLRIGIHTGPLMAGVIGKSKFAYDVWGDAVNIAARLESAGEAGRVNVSSAVRERIGDAFPCVARGRIAAKNVGDIEMYFVDDNRS